MPGIVGVIPARYGSSRFPGKPLALLLGKPLVQWVYEGASKSNFLEEVIVATDDPRIAEVARNFGAKVAMTKPDHASGTDRIVEALRGSGASVVINIQADEPLIEGWMIDRLIPPLVSREADLTSLMAPVYDLSLADDCNRVKVVVDKRGYALYFSRSPVPFAPDDFFYQHIGIYGFQRDVLEAFSRLEPSRLEKTERLEQLRALENGYRIRMVEIDEPTVGVDTPEDLARVAALIMARRR
ncbi:MAG: 3-deoxy-manno-octulosonate cytidylyltransferase [Candidatus Aminicenantales bacterium]